MDEAVRDREGDRAAFFFRIMHLTPIPDPTWTTRKPRKRCGGAHGEPWFYLRLGLEPA